MIMGGFLEDDSKNSIGLWNLYLRMRVTMNVEKPLLKRIKIKLLGGEWTWIHFRYERLSNFYHKYG